MKSSYDFTSERNSRVSNKLLDKTQKNLLHSGNKTGSGFYKIDSAIPFARTTLLKNPESNTNIWWSEGIGPQFTEET